MVKGVYNPDSCRVLWGGLDITDTFSTDTEITVTHPDPMEHPVTLTLKNGSKIIFNCVSFEDGLTGGDLSFIEVLDMLNEIRDKENE